MTFFEICHVYSGYCQLVIDSETHHLQPGSLCVIAPESRHTLLFDSDAVIITILIRRSTFYAVFSGLLSFGDQLAAFFRQDLRSPNLANYLLFEIAQDDESRSLVQRLLWESSLPDNFSNVNSASLFTQLMICTLL